MTKETAIKYAELLNEKSIMSSWYDYDNVMKSWYVYNVFRRFYTVKALKNYAGGKLK